MLSPLQYQHDYLSVFSQEPPPELFPPIVRKGEVLLPPPRGVDLDAVWEPVSTFETPMGGRNPGKFPVTA